jgi:hypothetical protein
MLVQLQTLNSVKRGGKKAVKQTTKNTPEDDRE